MNIKLNKIQKMEVIYSAKSCEEEDSEEFEKHNQLNQNNILEQISSDSNLSSEINSFENINFPETINNLSENENDFEEIPIPLNIPEKIPQNEAVPFVIYEKETSKHIRVREIPANWNENYTRINSLF